VFARDNTVSFGRLKLQLPESPLRHHFVKARMRVHHYRPRCLARYDAAGAPAATVPTRPSVTPCSPPSRRGLEAAELEAPQVRRPALTAAAPAVMAAAQVGTKKRPSGRTKKLTGSKIAIAANP
jgi:hypothetical protein